MEVRFTAANILQWPLAVTRSRLSSECRCLHGWPEPQYGSVKIHPFSQPCYQDDNISRNMQKRPFWDALNQHKSTMGCRKLTVSYKELTEPFMRVLNTSPWDSLELPTVRIQEGQ